MVNDSEDAGAAGRDGQLGAELQAWFAVEEVTANTLEALIARGDGAALSAAFVRGIHRAVRAWLAFEFWACLLEPGVYTPDELFESLLERGVETTRLPRRDHVQTPVVDQIAWRGFPLGSDE